MGIFSAQKLTLSHRRDGDRVTVLRDASFELNEGCIYDLVGPSGCGKSTLLRACALLMERDAGELILDDMPASSFAPALWRSKVMLVPQKPSLVPGTVGENLLLPYTLKVRSGETAPSQARLRSLLDAAGLADVELDREVSQLSGGQTARVALVRAFATNARVLLLDEVDAALDAESSRAVGQLTKAVVGEGRTCLRITHRAPDGLASACLRIEDGKLLNEGGAR